jgi:hypothetical protein
MKTAFTFALLGLVTLCGCGQRSDNPAATTSDGKVNAGSTVSESTSETPTGQANAEEPETGTNTGRPDAPKDLQPGTDGNTRPPAP